MLLEVELDKSGLEVALDTVDNELGYTSDCGAKGENKYILISSTVKHNYYICVSVYHLAWHIIRRSHRMAHCLIITWWRWRHPRHWWTVHICWSRMCNIWNWISSIWYIGLHWVRSLRLCWIRLRWFAYIVKNECTKIKGFQLFYITWLQYHCIKIVVLLVELKVRLCCTLTN